MIEQTTLRDELARERTILANERTLLAYGRTTLGLVGLAVIIFKFTDDPNFAVIVGSFVLLAAGFTMFLGMKSYRATNARIVGDAGVEENAFAGEVLSILEAE